MTFRHRFDPTTLREYDIRGIVGKTLGPEDAHAIGRTFASLVARAGGRRLVIGHDGRLSSPSLEHALVEGAMASGMAVQRIGCGPTPMLYFAAIALGADAAVMVTGSHNPPDYNGFKMVRANRPFFGAQIRELGRLSAAGDVIPHRSGTVRDVDIRPAYVTRLLRDQGSGPRPLKVVWDNASSAAGDVLSMLVARLPGTHHILNGDIDGHFPAHHPDPTIPANMRQLAAAVRAEKADIGLAFDGDADRLGVVDETGTIIWADQLLVLLARDVLRTRPGATIIADVKASQILFDEIARAGGTPLMWKSGHSPIKTRMAETDALLAGEMSGHFFFADHWYGFDDALYAAVRVLEMVSHLKTPLSALRTALPARVSTPELRFDCPESRKFAVIAEVAARLEKTGATVCAIDGVRVSTPDGWWLLRASNTQAALTARAEGTTGTALARLQAELCAQLAQSGIAAPDFTEAGNN
ncbi:Phosphomannomutase [Gluconacetobacter sp. SXCC-1]|uniref:Phosphomannomutase/phosphoglucomutase n=1 Tax=Komagataeibacter rhaeticus TaxID=215221 RepID=A0A181CAZ1_9PROT|nr:phosphomannomutase/phosphoglucomutase [Komagataeibacter rhaeticus]ATU72596.1 phosphomannomutase/phosphoglucomutase [Komagataeibacter xylinus]EGG74589.1 Phosphomannomutase [Gluconacetobacter sp. SXCC-1]QIP35489.1 phosphomannomutase/phosphoglucomutase [Komagataeibacter rhaeticus]QOC45245.1 phosphomannomutase/phosphoglucomutase [Komagataeibacter rhaeticus]WPP22350.1 phosphomannomutase/phosphoglucomutase [Komagataeibacter rhaeticus]